MRSNGGSSHGFFCGGGGQDDHVHDHHATTSNTPSPSKGVIGVPVYIANNGGDMACVI